MRQSTRASATMPHENEPTLRDFAGCCTIIFSPSTRDNSESLDLSALGAIGWRGFRLGCPGQSECVELANGARRRNFLQVPGFYVERKGRGVYFSRTFFSMEILCLAEQSSAIDLLIARGIRALRVCPVPRAQSLPI